MKWGFALLLLLAAVILLMPKKGLQIMTTENKNNSAERMKQIRKIKKQKAIARQQHK